MTAQVLPLKKRSIWEPVKGVPYLKLNLESGVYFVRKFRSGKGELFKSTGQTKRGMAQTMADKMIADWIGGKNMSPKHRSIAMVIVELTEFLERACMNGDRRPQTWAHDQDMLPMIERYFGDVAVEEIDEDYWTEWVNSTGRGLGHTLFDTAKYLSKVLTYAYRRKYIPRKPVIANPDKQSKKGRVYTDDEIAAILEKADAPLLLQIALGYECGLRTGEIRGLRWDMLRSQGETLILTLPDWFVKANARKIQISPYAANLLRARKRVGEFVFPAHSDPFKCETKVYQNRRWRKAVAAAKIKGKARFYDLRHTFYNKALLELGLPIQQVSEYGGTSIRTLQRAYLNADPSRTAVVAGAISLKPRGT